MSTTFYLLSGIILPKRLLLILWVFEMNPHTFKLDQGHLACRTQLPLTGPVSAVFAVIVFIVVVLVIVVLIVVLVVICVVVIFLVVNFLAVVFSLVIMSYEWLADPDRHPDVS